MNITAVRIAGDELCLKSPDFAEIRRFAYHFKAGNYEIERKRKKRSTDANALCWKLCTEIANVLRTDKESVYVDMLKRYGQSDLVTVLSIVTQRAILNTLTSAGKALQKAGNTPTTKYIKVLPSMTRGK